MHNFRKVLLAVLIGVAILLSNLTPALAASTAPVATLNEFVAALPAGSANQVTGVYASGVFALPVVQQPAGDAGFVSSQPEVLTQFALASSYGTTGMLAHNTLAGAHFSNLEAGQFLTVVYGDGRTAFFQITAVERYQALQPTSPYSDFVDTATQSKLSATDLFYHIYNGDGQLVLQTCIEAEGNASWGRLFIIAEPADLEFLSIVQDTFFAASFTSFGLAQE